MSLDPIVNPVSVEEITNEQAKDIYNKFINNGMKVPRWMQVMANTEDIMVGFFTMFKATMDDSPLPGILKWKVADEVSRMNKCEFCIDVTQAQLRQFGLDDEALSQINEQANEREKVALAFARAVTEKAYEIDPAITAEVKKHFSDKELVELTACIGLFNYINRFNDALRVLPE